MNRSMVLLVIFDVPNSEKTEQRYYRRFRKYLLSNGYVFLQESVYVKLLRSLTIENTEISNLEDIAPVNSNNKIFTMTLNEFNKMTDIGDSKFDFSIFSDNVLYI